MATGPLALGGLPCLAEGQLRLGRTEVLRPVGLGTEFGNKAVASGTACPKKPDPFGPGCNSNHRGISRYLKTGHRRIHRNLGAVGSAKMELPHPSCPTISA